MIASHEEKVKLLEEAGFEKQENSCTWSLHRCGCQFDIDIDWDIEKIRDKIHVFTHTPVSKKHYHMAWIVVTIGFFIGVVMTSWVISVTRDNNESVCIQEPVIEEDVVDEVEEYESVFVPSSDIIDDIGIPPAYVTRQMSDEFHVDRDARILDQGLSDEFTWDEMQFIYHIRRRINWDARWGETETRILMIDSSEYQYRVWTDRIVQTLEYLGYRVCVYRHTVSWDHIGTYSGIDY